VGQSIVYSYVPVEYAKPGTGVDVQFFGRRYPATVSREPRFDPAGARMKG
jgi:glycine cleavage system aminomethyltransferase T